MQDILQEILQQDILVSQGNGDSLTLQFPPPAVPVLKQREGCKQYCPSDQRTICGKPPFKNFFAPYHLLRTFSHQTTFYMEHFVENNLLKKFIWNNQFSAKAEEKRDRPWNGVRSLTGICKHHTSKILDKVEKIP